MGRYRKIETRTWGDDKFVELSPIPACGQGLWLYLLTGPHTNSIPGLFVSGKAALAEALNWEPEDFGKAFQELLDKKMIRFDPKTRLVWVPNAIKYNLPESPNVIRSWKGQIRELPDSELLTIAINQLKGEIYAMGEGFQKAFLEAFGKGFSKGLPQPSPNQEQEQEQEQEEEFAGPAEAVPEKNNPESNPTPDDFEPTLDPPESNTLKIPANIELSAKDLAELQMRFGARSQEAVDKIGMLYAAKDYRYKNHWAGVKLWLADHSSPAAWLDTATGKVKPSEPMSARQEAASKPVPKADVFDQEVAAVKSQLDGQNAMDFIRQAQAAKRAAVDDFDPVAS
jgi:hypothetical protein